MFFEIDEKFLDYMKNVKQVFLYLIDDCNLDCVQCLYKPCNYFYLNKKEIAIDTAEKLVSDMYELGARKLTIMGGEPTLYGRENSWHPLLKLIDYSHSLGYEYMRIDTNGTFDSELLDKPEFKLLNEVTFSLDGPNAQINDQIRGEGVFDKCVSNIKYAIRLGYNCDITCCIHKGLISRDCQGHLYIDQMIHFAESIGIKKINFHDLFKSGIPRDTWTGNINISLNQWFEVWTELKTRKERGEYSIPVRIPQCFTTQERFDNNKEYYGYCSAKLGERALIHPDGIIRVCSLLIGTPYGIAKYYDNRIVWDEGYTNELGDQEMESITPCTHQNKKKLFAPYVPLCVSFKPQQDEFVWNKLKWEELNPRMSGAN